MIPTPEQAARDLLERMDVSYAQGLTAGDVVELANLIANARALYHALHEMTEDLEARWNMDDPRTNPGIRANVAQARRVMQQAEKL